MVYIIAEYIWEVCGNKIKGNYQVTLKESYLIQIQFRFKLDVGFVYNGNYFIDSGEGWQQLN